MPIKLPLDGRNHQYMKLNTLVKKTKDNDFGSPSSN